MINPELPLGRRPVDDLARSHALDPLADALQPAIRAMRDSNPKLKGALSGTWLGHALHPLLTDVPIGAFSALAVLDAVEVATGADVTAGADVVLATGIASALGAALTGWSDWSDTSEGPRTVGLVHALANGSAVTTYLASLIARRAGARGLGIALGYLAFGALAIGGYLGGELSQGMQLGVKHTAEPLSPPDDFHDVAAESEVVHGKPLRVDACGIAIVLARTDGGIVALADACTHRGASLSEGAIEGDCIRCPWHGSRFALDDGSVREGPATFAQAAFDVRVASGRVAVRARRFA